VNAWEEEVRRRFGKRPEAHGVGPNHEGLIDDCLKLSTVAFQWGKSRNQCYCSQEQDHSACKDKIVTIFSLKSKSWPFRRDYGPGSNLLSLWITR
jgi:hypothetical protein